MRQSDSYPSLVQGVSQQVPHNRDQGRCTEQVNMLPDPVQGLARRHGSRWVAEAELTGVDFETAVQDTLTWNSISFTTNSTEYVVLIRKGPRVSASLPPVVVYDKTNKKFLTYKRAAVDPIVDAIEAGGVSAATPLGKFLMIAGNTVFPQVTTLKVWEEGPQKDNAAVWIRGGAYARTYSVTVQPTIGAPVTFSYKTPTSSYPNTLDTSGVPIYAADPAGGTEVSTESAYIRFEEAAYRAQLSWHAWTPTALTVSKAGVAMTNVFPAAPTLSTQFSWSPGGRYVSFHVSNAAASDITLTYTHVKTITNPSFSKTVTDLSNAYNSAVTTWIGTAAAAIQPDAIAEQLRLAAVAAGITLVAREGSHLLFSDAASLSVSDGGDGSLIRGVAQEINSVDQVTDVHYIGKVVKVRPKNSEEAFYLKAVQKGSAPSGYGEVLWVEGPGVIQKIENGLVFGLPSGDDFCLASSASLLNSLVPGDYPSFVESTVGDLDTCPLPYFAGRKISYLGVFQDRLLVGSGAVLRTSKVGDYLNFFRSSVLTVPADDPFEVLSQGTDDDELRYDAPYDRDLVIMGAKRQYVLSGRALMAPTSANMPVMSNHSDAATSPPLAVGGLIFYAKNGESAASVHQIMPGMNAESPESFQVSSQLDNYIAGDAIEMAAHAEPAVLFVRSKGYRNGLFTLHYMDTPEGRKQDAWGRWEFADALGPVIGMSSTSAGLLVFTLRQAAGKVWAVADLCPLLSELSPRPYLDSQRPWASVGTGSLLASDPGPWHVAFDSSSEYRFLGGTLASAGTVIAAYPSATGLTVGCEYPAYVVPTNPYDRDRNGRAVTNGRLTVTKKTAALANSSGLLSTVTYTGGTITKEYNGRRIGDPTNLIGRVPVTTQQVSVAIGKECRDYTLKLAARSWLPLTITSMEWSGQSFNR
jgi:hypothetical protein